MMELFVKIADGSKPLTIFTKRSVLDVLQSFEYVADFDRCVLEIR